MSRCTKHNWILDYNDCPDCTRARKRSELQTLKRRQVEALERIANVLEGIRIELSDDCDDNR